MGGSVCRCCHWDVIVSLGCRPVPCLAPDARPAVSTQVADKENELEAAQREIQDLRDQADDLVRFVNCWFLQSLLPETHSFLHALAAGRVSKYASISAERTRACSTQPKSLSCYTVARLRAACTAQRHAGPHLQQDSRLHQLATNCL